MDAGRAAQPTELDRPLPSKPWTRGSGRPRWVIAGAVGTTLAVAALLTLWAISREGGNGFGSDLAVAQAVDNSSSATPLRGAPKDTLRLAAHAAREAARPSVSRQSAFILVEITRLQAEVGDTAGVVEIVSLLADAKADHDQAGDARLALVVAHATESDIKGARAAADALADLAGRRAGAHAAIGSILVRSGRHAEAETSFVRAREAAIAANHRSDRLWGLMHLSKQRAAAGMVVEATAVARSMDELVRDGPPEEAAKSGTTVKEAYSAIALAHDRAGDRQAANNLLGRVLLRDGILLRFVEQRSQALDLDGVNEAIQMMEDPFLRGRACFAAARLCIALGPAFDKQSSVLMDVGEQALKRYVGRSDHLMHTLLSDLALSATSGSHDRTGLLDKIYKFPPEYRVPGWAAVAVSAASDGQRQEGADAIGKAVGLAATIAADEYVQRVGLLDDAMAHWTLEVGDADALALAKDQQEPSVRAACLLGVARGQMWRENLLALASPVAVVGKTTLWEQLTTVWGPEAGVKTDRVLYVDKWTEQRGRRRALAARTASGVTIAFPQTLAGWAWVTESMPPLEGGSAAEQRAMGKMTFGPAGAETTVGSYRLRRSVMLLPPHWVVITIAEEKLR